MKTLSGRKDGFCISARVCASNTNIDAIIALYLGSHVLYDVEALSTRGLIYRTLPGRYITDLGLGLGLGLGLVRVRVSVIALYLGSRVLYDMEAWSPRGLIYRTLLGRYIMDLGLGLGFGLV